VRLRVLCLDVNIFPVFQPNTPNLFPALLPGALKLELAVICSIPEPFVSNERCERRGIFNPVDYLEVCYKELGREDDWIFIHWWISRNRRTIEEFCQGIRRTRALQYLVRVGVDREILLLTCAVFWSIRQVNLPRIPLENGHHFDQSSRHYLHAGRPPSPFPIFQDCCDELVSGRTDHMRFYRQFCELAAIIFRDKPTTFHASENEVESYRRTLMRERRRNRTAKTDAQK
jgi:hypothetical protein